MPKRDDIKKILIIGSGPIVIGQACEFDYSGTQACKALKKMGYETVLVNSNPATIMTDPQTADVTYIEPLNVKRLTEIIETERPDALLPNLGGQTGLNLSSELSKAGVLDKFGVRIIGVQLDAIERGEDRIQFKETMSKLGIEMPVSEPAYSVSEAERIAEKLGFPCVIRPAYTMGGTGGGIVYNLEELKTVTSRGIAASMVGQVLVEESVIGWEELELEVVRDSKNKIITVCFIENIDPMGVHTGDSFCAAPMLNVSVDVQQRLQKQAYSIVESIEVIGGCNCQFAYNPKEDRIVVIEINPRTSRSSALASKATGFPIAYISSLLAVGVTLDEIPYWRFGTLDKYTPYGDYVVIKFPRWAFEKFKDADDRLGTQMKAVGEVMSIGKNYKEALQKAIRSLEIGRYGLGFAKNFNSMELPELLKLLAIPGSERHFILYEALRKGAGIDKLFELTKIKPYFLNQMLELVTLEEEIIACRDRNIPEELLRRAKLDGFSDKYLSMLLRISEDEIRQKRIGAGIRQSFDKIEVSGVDDACYYYSTYQPASPAEPLNDKKSVLILGGGPNRIGQGIEFDYCCVHAAFALRDMGFETLMVNCNPETVSTDFDTASRLYFDPLTIEDVLAVYEREKPIGAIVQFGGQTPLNLSAELERLGVPILGTTSATIDLAEDRDMFREIMDKLQIPMPESGMASNYEEALAISKSIGYPVMVRPSYVLGGRGMEIVYDDEHLRAYIAAAIDVTPERPILIDRFLIRATELEADGVCDGTGVFVPAVMQHIEPAGIHSGDSACIIPTISVSDENLRTIYSYTEKIGKELNVVGLINVQFAIENDKVYVIEANPRASRTVPLVSKVCNIQMATLATRFMLADHVEINENEKADNLKRPVMKYFGVKEAVFPFNMFPETDPLLGPEMRSTGETLGLADTFGMAFYKAEEAANAVLPTSGTVLLSIAKKDRDQLLPIAEKLLMLGFDLVATAGTCRDLKENVIPCREVRKYNEGRPDVIDFLKSGEIALVINTPDSKTSHISGAHIRRTAIRYKIPYATTIVAAKACVSGIEECISNDKNAKISVKSLQKYHAEMKIK